MPADTTARIPCPFVYASGKPCEGPVVRVEAYRADLQWAQDEMGNWRLDWSRPRLHFHVFCSIRGNHAGVRRSDDSRMKFYLDQLPAELRLILLKS